MAKHSVTTMGHNIWLGLKTPPRNLPGWLWLVLAAYCVLAVSIGVVSGLLEYYPLQSRLAPFLPLTLLVLPSMTEEIVFRGLLLPRDVIDRGVRAVLVYSAFSTAVYVAWHPVYARFINPKAATYFYDPRFLAIAALLGVTCAVGYAASKSLWVAILTHWATVMVWVFLFAGRNLVLD